MIMKNLDIQQERGIDITNFLLLVIIGVGITGLILVWGA